MRKTYNALGLIGLVAILAIVFSLSVSAVGADHRCEEDEDPAICYYAYDDCLIAECSYCGERYDATVSLDLQDGTVFSCTSPEIKVNDEGWADIDGMPYVVLYEGVGDTSYKLSAAAPENDGTYTATSIEKLNSSRARSRVEVTSTKSGVALTSAKSGVALTSAKAHSNY